MDRCRLGYASRAFRQRVWDLAARPAMSARKNEAPIAYPKPWSSSKKLRTCRIQTGNISCRFGMSRTLLRRPAARHKPSGEIGSRAGIGSDGLLRAFGIQVWVK